MIGLKKNLTSQGITPYQFAFQFVVVILGVYLAIVFEGKAEDRARANDANAMLVRVLSELTLDEGEMETLGMSPMQILLCSWWISMSITTSV